jgi:hypothetical protein
MQFWKRTPGYKDNLTDEARQLSLEKRRANAELRKAQQEAEIERLRMKSDIERLKLERERLRLQDELNELIGDDEEEEEQPGNVMEALALKLLQPQQTQQMQPATVTYPAEPGKVELGIDEINTFLQQVPQKYLELADKYPEEQIIKLLKAQGVFSNATDESLKKLVNMAKNLNKTKTKKK